MSVATNLSCFKCPTNDVKISPGDRKTLWLVHYEDDEYEGEIAICQGEDAEAYAHLFAAAPALLKACETTLESVGEYCDGSGDLDPWRLIEKLKAAIALAKDEKGGR